jgi:L-fucose/D-arabinose isomerase
MRSTPLGLVMMNDERPYVNETNEDETMAVLRRWAATLEPHLQAVDGTTPEIVLGRRSITSVRTAQQVGSELRRAGVRSVILCFHVWNFPYLVWPLLESLGRDVPVLSLSNNNGALPGNVGLFATDGALRQAGMRTHRIVGQVDDPATIDRVVDWARAAQAVTTLRGEVFGLYGGHSMGMETGYFHLVPNLKAFGTTASQIDQLQVVERMGGVDEREVSAGRAWLEDMLGDRLRYDGEALTTAKLDQQLRLYLALRELNDENGFDYCGLKAQRELTEHVVVADVAEALLNDPYDWNGPKEPTVCATEADAGAALTMQLMKYVSGGLPGLFMDMRVYHPELDLWDLCNSGQHATWYATRTDDARANYERVTLHPAHPLYFRAGGASVEFDAAPGELTFARLGVWDDQPFLVVIRGEAVELPAEERRRLNALTDPTWPHVHARMDCSFAEMQRVFPSNHIHAIPGDQVACLERVAELAGIQPVVLGRGDVSAPIWDRVAGSR